MKGDGGMVAVSCFPGWNGDGHFVHVEIPVRERDFLYLTFDSSTYRDFFQDRPGVKTVIVRRPPEPHTIFRIN